MYGSGAVIGGAVILLLRRLILLVLHRALTACVAAAVGATMRLARAWRAAAATRLAIAVAAWASALPAVPIRSVEQASQGVLPKKRSGAKQKGKTKGGQTVNPPAPKKFFF